MRLTESILTTTLAIAACGGRNLNEVQVPAEALSATNSIQRPNILGVIPAMDPDSTVKNTRNTALSLLICEMAKGAHAGIDNRGKDYKGRDIVAEIPTADAFLTLTNEIIDAQAFDSNKNLLRASVGLSDEGNVEDATHLPVGVAGRLIAGAEGSHLGLLVMHPSNQHGAFEYVDLDANGTLDMVVFHPLDDFDDLRWIKGPTNKFLEQISDADQVKYQTLVESAFTVRNCRD